MTEENVKEQRRAEASNPATNARRLKTLSADADLRVLVASNPAAPEPLLKRLAQDHNEAVRKNVASNPNTPWKCLKGLAWQFPQEFLHNPVVSMHLLAHPELIPKARPFGEGLLRAASLPAPWWDWLQRHPGLADREMVRLHIQCAGEVDTFWHELQSESVPTLLSLVELLVLEEHQTSALLAAPAPVSLSQSENPLKTTREETLWWLARSPETQIRALIASSTRVPTEILASLAQDHAWDVRRELACNQRMEVLVTLSRHTDASTRSRVAENEYTPVETLYVLAQDQERFVRKALLKNRRLPTEILASLAQDRDEEVRRGIASHPQTSEDVLAMLAQDRDEEVRKRVASHPQTSEDVLWTLARDKSLSVKVAVAENEQASAALLEALMKDEELWVKMSVVGNLRTPVALLRVHARHKDQNVRRVIAEHPRTPPEILASLAQDRDPSVQIAVAGNWQTPVEVLRALAHSEFEGLKHWGLKALAQNIQTPGDVLQMLAQNTQDSPIRWNATFVSRLQIELGESLDREEAGTILKDLFRTTVGAYPAIKVDSPENQFSTLVLRKDSALVRRAILTVLAMDWNVSTIGELYPSWLWRGKPDNGFHLLSPEVLQKLAISPNWKIRLLVASHEHTPEQTRQRLSQDGNRYVRAIARAKAAQMGEAVRQADPFS